MRESQRRGVGRDALANELLLADLAPRSGDLDSVLADLAELRGHLPDIDGLTLARDARAELERRVA